MSDSNVRKFSFVTLFPELVQNYFRFGVLARAQSAKRIEFSCVQLREFAIDKHGTIDGRPYGGGEGMVMRADSLAAAVDSVSAGEKPLVIVPSPRGQIWNTSVASNIAKDCRNLVFICPRFSGIDQRFIDHYEAQEFSMGDFVVSGGELPAIMFADSVARLMPGVLGDDQSAELDSFAPGMAGLLEYPLYTRPEEIWSSHVPEVLKSGDHKAILAWRNKCSLTVTQERRPDLIQNDQTK